MCRALLLLGLLLCAAHAQSARGHHPKDPAGSEDAQDQASCEAFSPLFPGMQRALDYWAARGVNATAIEEAGASCTGDCVQLKVYQNELYVKNYREGGETRTAAALMLVHRAVTMAAGPLPNVDVLLHSFDAGLEGWPVWGFCEREELGDAAPKFLVPGQRRRRG